MFQIRLEEEMDGLDYLKEERKKAQFDVDVMKVVWAGSRESFLVSDRMAKLVANDPVCLLFFFLRTQKVCLHHFICFFKHVHFFTINVTIN